MGGLTARFVASVKGEAGKRLEYPDGSINGLSLRVMPPRVEGGVIVEAGAKSWAVRYRTPSGVQRRLTLGGYPAVDLKKARTLALEALGKVATGEDVARDKQTQRRKAKLGRTERPQTLGELWAVYERDVLVGKRQNTRDFQTWLWARHIKPKLGAHELDGLDRGTIRAALKSIGEATPTTANRALGLVRHMLNHAVAEEYLKATPLAQMGALYEEKSRGRVLSDAELKTLWKAWDAAPANADVLVSKRMILALRLQLLTLTRAGDVSGIHEREVDTAARSWTIPAERFKSGRDHTVPLSPAAWGVLLEIFGPDPDKWKGYGFPNARDADKPMERRSLTKAMSRVITDAKMVRATPHDLRRTGATYLASERISSAPHVVTAVLGHSPEGPAVTQVYNRHRYDREKRAALEAWAMLLTEIVSGKPQKRSNVTPLDAARKRKRASPR